MKTLKTILLAVLVGFSYTANAQTADEIITNYLENTGGIENWNKLEGVKMSAKLNQGGMEIPIEITQLKDGRQMTVISFQGQQIKEGVFDGETLWSINFINQKAEKSDEETTANFKLTTNDFPSAFLNYKEKGYTVELMGKEDIDGTETFKIKLVKEPVTVDGIEEESVSYYFFDTENFVPIAVESEIKFGQAKGMTQEISFSDYDEVDGLYFAFTFTQGIKGQPGQPITMEKIELNPQVDDKEFAFPEEDPAPPNEDKN